MKAATGEVVTAEELGGGDPALAHLRGHRPPAHDDRDALRIVRRIVATFGPREQRPWDVRATVEPIADQTSSTTSSRSTPAFPTTFTR